MENPLYLGKSESNRVKGFLMLLIILGHNHLLAPVHSLLFDYLYSFHFVCFFILPYFYDKKLECTFANILKLSRRLLVPYMIFFGVCMLVSLIMNKSNKLSFMEILSGLFIGSPYLLRKSVGFIFLWFLPSFFCFSLLRLLASKMKLLDYFFLSVSFLTIFLSLDQEEILKNTLPLGLMFALKFYWMGWMCFKLLKYTSQYLVVWFFAFICFSAIFVQGKLELISIRMIPLFAFPAICALLPFLRRLPLDKIGKYSFGMYLVHVFVLSLFQRVLPQNIAGGILEYLMGIWVSYIVVKLMYKLNLNKIVFPK